ncbi:hypothetical protein Hypma_013740 [Hypsizygus marmoreus]|uniref:Uncharacterized protein n=1 Tax=Hypsizygus marmoreus TaxID=39966 RepID=A0A369JII0_HYPMA|nr:hypothetical protein Hypma_013740 [Hypsizygus marmoreus]
MVVDTKVAHGAAKVVMPGVKLAPGREVLLCGVLCKAPVPRNQPPEPPVVVPPPPVAGFSADVEHAPSWSEDSDGESEEGIVWDPMPGEKPGERLQRLAHNTKVHTQAEKSSRLAAENAELDARKDPGRVPDGLGVVKIHGRYERSNEFWGFIEGRTYYSRLSNNVFAGSLAPMAAKFEQDNDGEFQVPVTRLYSHIPRGFPMNPFQVTRIQRFYRDKKETDKQRIQAFCLFEAFVRIAHAHRDVLHDRAMQEAARIDAQSIYNYVPLKHKEALWVWDPMPHDWDRALNPNRDNRTKGAGLVQPEGHHDLQIDQWAKYFIHHTRPTSNNPIGGLVMTHAHHLHRRSVWGYLLGRALSP